MTESDAETLTKLAAEIQECRKNIPMLHVQFDAHSAFSLVASLRKPTP